eukprot:TRINITY_DN22963_c0_g1_i1.p1 TRINITY_DN22963_c0_g1~~TRINITY_DN22963_c0_g1_i1.p1  ORF type:complete len:956 (-),score=163.05 TRINITY_DN22963_c0_g1_i1:263-3052(-)
MVEIQTSATVRPPPVGDTSATSPSSTQLRSCSPSIVRITSPRAGVVFELNLRETVEQIKRLADEALPEEDLHNRSSVVKGFDGDGDPSAGDVAEAHQTTTGDFAIIERDPAVANTRLQSLLKQLHSHKRHEILEALVGKLQAHTGPSKREILRMERFERDLLKRLSDEDETARKCSAETHFHSQSTPAALEQLCSSIGRVDSSKQRHKAQRRKQDKGDSDEHGLPSIEGLPDESFEAAIVELEQKLHGLESDVHLQLQDCYVHSQQMDRTVADPKAMTLNVTAQREFNNFSGRYLVVIGERVNGEMLWKKEKGEVWLYSAESRWGFGGAASTVPDRFASKRFRLANRAHHGGRMPDELNDVWEAWNPDKCFSEQQVHVLVRREFANDLLMEQEKAIVFLRETILQNDHREDLCRDAKKQLKMNAITCNAERISTEKAPAEVGRLVLELYGEAKGRVLPHLLRERDEQFGKDLEPPDESFLNLLLEATSALRQRQTIAQDITTQLSEKDSVEAAAAGQLAQLEAGQMPQLVLIESIQEMIGQGTETDSPEVVTSPKSTNDHEKLMDATNVELSRWKRDFEEIHEDILKVCSRLKTLQAGFDQRSNRISSLQASLKTFEDRRQLFLEAVDLAALGDQRSGQCSSSVSLAAQDLHSESSWKQAFVVGSCDEDLMTVAAQDEALDALAKEEKALEKWCDELGEAFAPKLRLMIDTLRRPGSVSMENRPDATALCSKLVDMPEENLGAVHSLTELLTSLRRMGNSAASSMAPEGSASAATARRERLEERYRLVRQVRSRLRSADCFSPVTASRGFRGWDESDSNLKQKELMEVLRLQHECTSRVRLLRRVDEAVELARERRRARDAMPCSTEMEQSENIDLRQQTREVNALLMQEGEQLLMKQARMQRAGQPVTSTIGEVSTCRHSMVQADHSD